MVRGSGAASAVTGTTADARQLTTAERVETGRVRKILTYKSSNTKSFSGKVRHLLELLQRDGNANRTAFHIRNDSVHHLLHASKFMAYRLVEWQLFVK